MTTMAPVLIKAIADIYSFDDKQQTREKGKV
jgi:hypothetical protein